MAGGAEQLEVGGQPPAQLAAFDQAERPKRPDMVDESAGLVEAGPATVAEHREQVGTLEPAIGSEVPGALAVGSAAGAAGRARGRAADEAAAGLAGEGLGRATDGRTPSVAGRSHAHKVSTPVNNARVITHRLATTCRQRASVSVGADALGARVP